MRAAPLTETYDAIRADVASAWHLVFDIGTREGRWVQWLVRRYPVQYTRRIDRDVERIKSAATPEERRDPLFAAVTTPYWLESLGAHLCTKYELTQADARALQKIHAAR